MMVEINQSTQLTKPGTTMLYRNQPIIQLFTTWLSRKRSIAIE